MPQTTMSAVAESVLGQPSVLVIFAVSATVLGLVAGGVAARRGWRQVPAVLAGVSLALAVAVTQGRQPFELGGLDFAGCTLTSFGSSPIETLLNAGMLMPLGFLAACATRRLLGPALFCLASSVLAEAAQGAFNTGACVGQDVLANSLGGAVAALAGWAVVRGPWRAKPRTEPAAAPTEAVTSAPRR